MYMPQRDTPGQPDNALVGLVSFPFFTDFGMTRIRRRGILSRRSLDQEIEAAGELNDSKCA